MYGQWRKPNIEPTAFGQAMQQSELYDPTTAAVARTFAEEATVGVGTLKADIVAADVTKAERDGSPITEDEYKNSAELYSEGVAWKEGMTRESALVTKEFNDAARKRAQIISDSSTSQAALGFAAGFGAGIFEPKNVVSGLAVGAALGPLAEVGVLGKSLQRAYQMRKTATLGQRAAMGAAEGVVAGVAIEPSSRYSAKILQQDYTMMDSLFNVATSAAFGSLVPVAGAGLKNAAPFMKEKIAKFKGRTMDVVTAEVDLATTQFASGQRVDVGVVEAAEVGSVARKPVADQAGAARDAVKTERGIDILPSEESVKAPEDLTVKSAGVIETSSAINTAQTEWREGLSPRTARDLQEPTSWVLREKDTGKTVMETSNAEAVQKLNTNKYEAVPIIEHLANLNGQTYSKAPDATLKAERVRDAAFGGENLADITARIDEQNAATLAKAQADALDPQNDTLIDYDAIDAADERRAITGVENEAEAEAYFMEAEAEIRQMIDQDILNEADLSEYRSALEELDSRAPVDALETLKLCLTRG